MSITGVPAPDAATRHREQERPASIVVVGAGLAGAQTVAALRRHGFDGRVTLVGAEKTLPYDRPPLSKELVTRAEPAWLSDELDVDVLTLADDVRLAESAVGMELLDDGVVVRTRRTASAHDTDDTISADAVVLACGARAVRPTAWPDALVLYTASDAAALRQRLASAHRLVVVGAGWIGAEVAGVVAASGTAVTVVEAAPEPLAGPLGADVGALTRQWYADAGITLLTGVTVGGVDATGVVLADGTRLPADVVLAAVGAVPDTAWLRGTLPLTARGALPVGPTGSLEVGGAAGGPTLSERAASRVWAVGDCADRRTDRFGVVAGAHWTGALTHPEAVACAITGHPAPPESAPYVFSDQLGHHLTVVGTPEPDAEVVHRGSPGAPDGWTTLWVRRPTDGAAADVRELLAVLTVDRPRDVGPARRLLAGSRPPMIDMLRACDPAVPLKASVVGPAPSV